MIWAQQSDEERLWQSARTRAIAKQLPFSITAEDIVITSHCPFLKKPMIKNTQYAPSLDRIIPSLGYVPGNVEVVSRLANQMKSNALKDDLLEFAYEVLERN